jgi:chromate transporter
MGEPPNGSRRKCLELLLIFSKISAFTLGGGLAMIPLIEREIVGERGWVEEGEFLDLIGITQSMPGALAINISTCVGYKVAGAWGALSATLGAIIPPFLSILLAASFLMAAKDVPIVERAFQGIRPAVVALIAASVLRLSRAAGMGGRGAAISIAVALIVLVSGVHPVYVAAIGMGASALWAIARARRPERI